MMNKTKGTLRYSINPIKLIVEIDPDISNFYRSLIPKYYRTNKPMFEPHISVVRKIVPPNMEHLPLYEGNKINFEYESFIYNDELYYQSVARKLRPLGRR